MSEELFETVDWGLLARRLLKHSIVAAKKRKWREPGILALGYDHEDVVWGAIEAVIEEKKSSDFNSVEEIYDTVRKKITNKLKTLSANHANRLDKQDTRRPIFATILDDEEIHEFLLDSQRFKEKILKKIGDDDLLKCIFLDLMDKESERKEICQDYGLETKEYDNLIRKLRTRIEPILNQYGIWRIKKK